MDLRVGGVTACGAMAGDEEAPPTTVRQSTDELQETFALRMDKSMRDLQEVTGQPMDINRSEFAVGDCYLTFKDIGFAMRPKSGSFLPGSVFCSTKRKKTLQSEKVILAPLSGHYEPGNLVALMGPSGSGKTTLLDILADKKTAPYSGTVHINGRPRDQLFHRISAYVPQEDHMPAHMTVEEVVRFHSLMKEQRPSRFTREMEQLLSEKRMKVLGLLDCRNTYVGDPAEGCRGISGGQRRRLSLARGLASGAQLIFCDEPTSGLSATDAEHCMRYMRLLAHKYSVTIFVSIHQPRREVAKLFDQLILLTSNPGRVVYQGFMKDLPAYAQGVGVSVPTRSNPTDFLLDLVTPGTKSSREEDFVKHYETYSKPAINNAVDRELCCERKTPLELLAVGRQHMLAFGDMPPVKDSKYVVSFWKQFRVVFARQLLLRSRDKMLFCMDLCAAIGKAAVVALAYWDISSKSAPLQLGFLFFVLMASSIDGLKTMPKVISERTIMKMETSEGLYSEWAYIIGFSIISSVQAILMHSLFIVLMWPALGFPWELFLYVWLWTLLHYFVMDSVFLMLSGIAKDATMGQVLSLPFLLLFLLYNGFTVSRHTCPDWLMWALEISPVAYAMEAMTMAASEICRGQPCGKDSLYPALVQHFEYQDETPLGLAVVFTGIFIFRAVHIACLKFLNNIQR